MMGFCHPAECVALAQDLSAIGKDPVQPDGSQDDGEGIK